MNYEKAYKDALERMKSWARGEHPECFTEAQKAAEFVFPELAESEDGRIRKGLIKAVSGTLKGNTLFGTDVTREDALTWLEKQGKEEYTLKSSKDEDVRKFMQYIEKEAKAYEFNLPNRGYDIYAFAKDILAWLEKQGESIKIKKGKNYLCTKTHKYAGVEWVEGVEYYSPEDYSLVNQGCTCYCPKYSKEEHNNFFKEVEYDGWLEKQGDKDTFIKEEPECIKGYRENAIKRLEELETQCEQKSIDELTQQDAMDIAVAKCFEQGEQKEYTFKSLPRLLEMVEPTERAKAYCQKLIDTLVKEGYAADAKIVGECLKQMNGEKVALATMDEKQAPKLKWTEEDDYNVKCCIAKAEFDIANGCPGRNKELIDWLKSIKQRMEGEITSKNYNKIIWLEDIGKMTKEDYMLLPKERLAEMLVAKNNEPPVINIPFQSTRLQCYEPGGICTNPFRDCINCPRVFGDQSYTITTSQTILKDEK